ncbi:hypothetical protein OH76DRAFT_893065 [Lentinus brumalis]|uniref:Uncharacterized protein n=1 Tax=Lentinus brumalis TaxID=2498619 RepID=A0A371D1A3_9APHY|nr:hypothetical protein OH76DRAFT_893065 [Polyporus brumalis]
MCVCASEALCAAATMSCCWPKLRRQGPPSRTPCVGSRRRRRRDGGRPAIRRSLIFVYWGRQAASGPEHALDANKVGPWLTVRVQDDRHRGSRSCVVCRGDDGQRTAALAVTPASSAPRRKFRGPVCLPLLAPDSADRSSRSSSRLESGNPRQRERVRHEAV